MSKLLQQKWQHEKLLHNSFDLNSHRTLAPGGDTPGNSSWGVRPVFQSNPDRFQTKKCNYPHPFSDLAFRQKLCYHYQIKKQTQRSSEFISN